MEAVFTANHLTDTDKQSSTCKYNSKTQTTKNSKTTTMVHFPLTTLDQKRDGLESGPRNLHLGPLGAEASK